MWDAKPAFEEAARGDERAFEEIVLHFEKVVFHAAFRELDSEEDAKDATQEVFLRLWRSLPLFRGECSPVTWILRITKTVTLDMLRRRKGRKTEPLQYENDEGETVEIDLPDTDPAANPPEAVIREETTRAVRDAIASLPDHYREILTLRDVNGLSYTDIVEYLGLDMGTVKSRLSRARIALRNLLKERNIL